MLKGRKQMSIILDEQKKSLKEADELLISVANNARITPRCKKIFNERQSVILNDAIKILFEKFYEYGEKKYINNG